MTLTSPIVQRIAMKAVIVHDGKVLILREASSYDEGTNGAKYQLPGGRVEAGEDIFDALKREVMEETGLEIEIEGPIFAGEWRPVIRGVAHQIVGMFFVCTPKNTDVILSSEHDDYRWILPSETEQYKVIRPDNEAIANYPKIQLSSEAA